jgi:hypothetical protein
MTSDPGYLQISEECSLGAGSINLRSTSDENLHTGRGSLNAQDFKLNSFRILSTVAHQGQIFCSRASRTC